MLVREQRELAQILKRNWKQVKRQLLMYKSFGAPTGPLTLNMILFSGQTLSTCAMFQKEAVYLQTHNTMRNRRYVTSSRRTLLRYFSRLVLFSSMSLVPQRPLK